VLADLPPSPRTRRQQSHRESGVKYATDANTAKVSCDLLYESHCY